MKYHPWPAARLLCDVSSIFDESRALRLANWIAPRNWKRKEPSMIRSIRRLAVCVAAAMLSHAVVAHAGLTDAELGVAGPADFQVLSLGSTSTGTTSLNLNASTVTGNVGVADDGTFKSGVPNSVSGSGHVGASVNTSGV
jgi:hypothetical protein